MDRERLERQFDFIKEIDKEKFIQRQTKLSDGVRRENDAEHAWHMAIMTVLLSEYANEKIDVLRTVTMLLIHDIVEMMQGIPMRMMRKVRKPSMSGRSRAADRIYSLLPEDRRKNCGISGKNLRRVRQRKPNLHILWIISSRRC